MKKFLISLFIFFCLFFNINSFAESWENTPNNCTWENSICSTSYIIDTSEYWLWWEAINQWWTAKETVDNWLKLIVNKLLIAFWVLSLFIMTIGWWYMIFAHWQDELLNKWKSIFTAWLTSLIIALSAWIIMKIVISLLY